MAQGDAAGVNGSNRILSHGAPPWRMMPNGCLGSPVIVLLFGLDRGFLMDVRPKRATNIVLSAVVDVTGEGWWRCDAHRGETDTPAQVRLRA